MDGPDPFGAYHLLLAGHDIFQKVNGDVVVRRKVDSDIGGKEVVDLALAVVLCLELLR